MEHFIFINVVLSLVKTFHSMLPRSFLRRNNMFGWWTTLSTIQQTPLVVPLITTAAWLWYISPPQPWIPLWNGLTEGSVQGFCVVSGQKQNLLTTEL
jgi:hypothetical protein